MRTLIAFAAALSTLTFAVPAEADIVRWDSGQVIPGTEGIVPGPGVQLNDRELHYAALWGYSLEQANFASSDLSNARFDANLDFCSIDCVPYADNSDLTNASFRGANLTGVLFGESPIAGADLTDAIVTGASFTFSTTVGLVKEQLYATASYKNKSLSGVGLSFNNLAGWDFSGQDLSNAGFRGSELFGVSFSGANVSGADFEATTERGFSMEHLYSTASYTARELGSIGLQSNDLRGWDFRGQRMAGADLSYSELENADLRDADLRDARLIRVNLTGADLRGADLTGVRFISATLAGTQFAGAKITRVDFTGSTDRGFTKEQLYSTTSYADKNLAGIQLWQNDLSGWDFSGQDLHEARFGEAKLTGTNFTGATINGANFRNTTRLGFTREQLTSTASYQAGDLSRVVLTGNEMRGWDFRGFQLADADLSYSDLSNADFKGAVLKWTGFNQSFLENADFTGADVRWTRFAGSPGVPGNVITKEQLYSTASYQSGDLTGLGLAAHTLDGWDLANKNLTRANFSYAWLAGADFTGSIVAGASFYATTNRGFTATQLYSTASYKARELPDLYLTAADVTGWDFSFQNLTGARLRVSLLQLASFYGANLINVDLESSLLDGADLSMADTRGARITDYSAANIRNTILPDGTVLGLELVEQDRFVVRNHLPHYLLQLGPFPVHVVGNAHFGEDSITQIQFDADEWNSTISFEAGIRVTLGGTLELAFAAGVDVAGQAGRTFPLFDWTGVSPIEDFDVTSVYLWDLADLYESGEVTLISAQSGDANGDRVVDLNDLNLVRNHFGAEGEPGLAGDVIPFDGRVDLQDLNFVRNTFGSGVPRPVPEATTRALSIVCLAALAGRAFHRRWR